MSVVLTGAITKINALSHNMTVCRGTTVKLTSRDGYCRRRHDIVSEYESNKLSASGVVSHPLRQLQRRTLISAETKCSLI